VGGLLEIDDEYRHKAGAEELVRTAAQRFNQPGGRGCPCCMPGARRVATRLFTPIRPVRGFSFGTPLALFESLLQSPIIQRCHMAEKAFPAEPTASSLKKELGESLDLLKRDFEGLKHFVTEIAPEGIPASIPISRQDLNDLLTATSEIHDAAEDIAFEARIIRGKLERLG
jgi:hypothetical protein